MGEKHAGDFMISTFFATLVRGVAVGGGARWIIASVCGGLTSTEHLRTFWVQHLLVARPRSDGHHGFVLD